MLVNFDENTFKNWLEYYWLFDWDMLDELKQQKQNNPMLSHHKKNLYNLKKFNNVKFKYTYYPDEHIFVNYAQIRLLKSGKHK